MPTLTEWPNKLGFDLGDIEIWKHKECFRVFTPELVMLIPYEFTTDPLVAARTCSIQGYRRDELEEMDPRDADQILRERKPCQRSLAFPLRCICGANP